MNRHGHPATTAASTLVGLACTLATTYPAFAQYSADNESRSTTTLVAMLIVWLIVLALYFIPTFVAFSRTHPNRWAIFVVNFAFGATGLGWLGSLVWAFNAVHRSATGSDGGESGLNLFVNDTVTMKVEPSVSSPSDELLADKLQRLKRLLESGAIDTDEYAAMRQPIVDQLLK